MVPEGKVVLVVEDEIPLIKVIKTKLDNVGFQAVTARNMKEAINAMEDIGDVDLFWIDHYLGVDSTGLDLVKQLKGDVRWKDKPIFVVSVTAGPETIDTYYKLGVTRFYTKHDFKIDYIISDIKRIIGAHK